MMTMHPGRDVLLAHADGELPDDDVREVVSHLEDCTECSTAVAGLRSESLSFAGALDALDAAEPAHWSRPGDVLQLRPRKVRTAPAARRSRASDMLRWAAGVMLVAAATVSAAVVGARFLSDATETTPPAQDPAMAAPGVATVMVSPVAGAVDVAVSGAGSGSRLFVTVADRADASVAVEGTGSPRFRAVDGRVDVDLDGATAVVRLTVPQSLRRANVTANGITMAAVEDGRITPADAAAAGVPLDAAGARME